MRSRLRKYAGFEPVEVREAVALGQHRERPVALLVGHVLGRGGGAVGRGDRGVGRPVAELLPRVAQVDAVRVRERRAVLVGIPVGEGGDEADRVEALALAIRDRFLEADARARDVVARGRPLASPGQAPRRRREPGVAEQEERRAVGVLRARGRSPWPARSRGGSGSRASRPRSTATARSCPRPPFRPGSSGWFEPVRQRHSPGAVATKRTLKSRPPSQNPYTRRAKPGPLEVDPADDLGVGVRVRLRRPERDLLQLPHVGLAPREYRAAGRCEAGRREQEDERQEPTRRRADSVHRSRDTTVAPKRTSTAARVMSDVTRRQRSVK